MKNVRFFLAMVIALTFTGCATTPNNKFNATADPLKTEWEKSSKGSATPATVLWAKPIPVFMEGAQYVLPCRTYNNASPGAGTQFWPGVERVMVCPTLSQSEVRIWFFGPWGKDGKMTVTFNSKGELEEYCMNPLPSIAELRELAEKEESHISDDGGKPYKVLPRSKWKVAR